MKSFRAYFNDGSYYDFNSRSWIAALEHAGRQAGLANTQLQSLERF